MQKTVEPIRDINDIKAIDECFAQKNIRNQLIFAFGTNIGLRVSDILKLNISDVKDKSYISLMEQKTGKIKQFPLNQKLQVLIRRYLRQYPKDYYSIANPLFISQKKSRLDKSQVYRFLKDVCCLLDINVRVGTHTMRKTFGYHHYKKFKDVAMLQTMFNHSSPRITLRYIGINQDEIDESYNQFCL